MFHEHFKCSKFLIFRSYHHIFLANFLLKNSPWLILESSKASEIKMFMLFNLYFYKILFYHASLSFFEFLTYTL